MLAGASSHLCIYRQAEIYVRQGIRLDRATLGNWSGRACFHLQPIADHMRRRLAMADRLFMDETTAPVLDPGRGQTKKGYFWAVVSDDRGHSGPSPPIVLFRYAPVAAVPSVRSSWMASADASCNAMPMRVMDLTEVARRQGPWRLVHCWSHCADAFSSWPAIANRRSPRPPFGTSNSFPPSKPWCAARRRTSGWSRARSTRCSW
ncbi:transposase (plasmid) [Bradyrhizobium japonicum]|nr:IS66 family transposase [Bradyrhizobium japonicum]MCD9825689.1 IS66 family transposase [Bradyrhizobium japonicum]MCD9898654.1 IS66 family transposase [Bradyrhizobium japonicum]WLB33904.1 transposase [Bradyrhizobium japonicum]